MEERRRYAHMMDVVHMQGREVYARGMGLRWGDVVMMGVRDMLSANAYVVYMVANQRRTLANMRDALALYIVVDFVQNMVPRGLLAHMVIAPIKSTEKDCVRGMKMRKRGDLQWRIMICDREVYIKLDGNTTQMTYP